MAVVAGVVDVVDVVVLLVDVVITSHTPVAMLRAKLGQQVFFWKTICGGVATQQKMVVS